MSDFDDERARGREAILKRRAQLVAYAVAAGVAMPACGGKSSCLSYYVGGSGNDGGRPTTATGGIGFCLSAPAGASFGGYGATSICLGMPYAGEDFGGTGGVAGAAGAPPESGGAAGEGGAGGAPPIFCLSAPLGGAPAMENDGGEGGGGGNGGAG